MNDFGISLYLHGELLLHTRCRPYIKHQRSQSCILCMHYADAVLTFRQGQLYPVVRVFITFSIPAVPCIDHFFAIHKYFGIIIGSYSQFIYALG